MTSDCRPQALLSNAGGRATKMRPEKGSFDGSSEMPYPSGDSRTVPDSFAGPFDGTAGSVSSTGGFLAQLRLPDLATRLWGMAVALDLASWVYLRFANLRRCVGPTRARSARATKANCPAARGLVSSPSVSHSRPIFTSSRRFDFRDGNFGMGSSGESAVTQTDRSSVKKRTIFETGELGYVMIWWAF